jgi:DNA-binding response OmpR family regulator
MPVDAKIRSVPGRTPSIAPKRSRQPTEAVISGRHILVGPVQILPEQLLVLIEGNRVWLTPREMDVLELLAAHAGRLLTRPTIFGIVWQRPLDPHDRSVDVQVAHLRAKLAKGAPEWEYIHTHSGGGYRFEPEPASPRANHREQRWRRGQSRL